MRYTDGSKGLQAMNGSALISRFTIPLALLGTAAGLALGQQPVADSLFRAKLADGVTAFRAGELDRAEQDFTEASKLNPRFAEAYMNLALVEERRGRSPEEIKLLKSALRLKPALKGANLFMGIAYYREDQFEEAKMALDREVRLSPDEPQAFMWLGIVDEAVNDPQSAVEVLDKAAKLAPKDVDILYNRGRAALLLSQKSYEDMYRVDPNSWRVHQVLAEAFAESDRHAQAVAEYLAAIKLSPSEPELYENLGREYWKGSQLDLAESQFAKEVELDPDNPMALYYLGSLHVERDQPNDGVPLLRKALEFDPSIADANYYLGRGEMATGDVDNAVVHFKKAIELAASAKESGADLAERSWYQLAIGYRRLQRTDEARAALDEFKKLKQQMDAAREQNLEDMKKRHEKAEAYDQQPPTPDPGTGGGSQ
jgi:tetratricopeptide (TPR) repeat protein